MAGKLLRAVLLLCALAPGMTAQAQVSAVAQIDSGWTISAEPTMAYLKLARQAQATLIYIPGGDGSVGMKPHWSDQSPYFKRNYFIAALLGLSDPELTSGALNVVIFDSPRALLDGPDYPKARASTDHLVRLDSVVQHYKQLLGKPVWLMGHSNGGISISEYYKYLQKHRRDNLLDGLIFSSGRDIASFNDQANIPALFMINENDACKSTTPAGNRRIFEKFRQGNQSTTESVLIRSGQAEDKDPCRSGLHMNYGAGTEVTSVVQGFILKHLPLKN
jgi:hypothetical protein